MADIYEAYLDGILLEMETIEDTFGKVIAKYSYPYVDGDDLEDMGQKGRGVRLRCYFIDNAVQQTYDDHITLLNHLADKSDFTLDHPKYGAITGKVEDVTTRHDDRERCAEIDLTFLEQMRALIDTTPGVEVVSVTEADFQAAQDEQMISLEADFNDLGLDAITSLDPGQPILVQIKGLTNTSREIAREVDGYIATLQATAVSVMQPVNSLVSTISYATTLPGRVLSSATYAVERLARLYDSLKNFPMRYLNNLKFAMDKLIGDIQGHTSGNSAGITAARSLMAKHVTVACAQRFALEAAYLYSSDEADRQKVRRSEKTSAWDVLGRYSAPSEAAAQIMTINDLESSLASARQFLQDATNLDRGITGLKNMALDLLTHVTATKLERDKIVSVTIDNPLPLHLVCLKYGLDYNYAERISSINSAMDNPTFVNGEVRIYVR